MLQPQPKELIQEFRELFKEDKDRKIRSLCFQKIEPPAFYGELLKQVFSFVKSFDEGTPAAREMVWKNFISLLGMPLSITKGMCFGKFLPWWLQQPSLSWFGLELLYIAFVSATITGSNLFALNNFAEENDQLRIHFSPWGRTVPSVLSQLVLLQHWESKLDKLSLHLKKAIWTTCLLLPTFTEKEEPSSFRNCFKKWTSDPLRHLNSIITFFGALGYLKENGILRIDFCYPKSNIPIFANKYSSDSLEPTSFGLETSNLTPQKRSNESKDDSQKRIKSRMSISQLLS
jgi:hypothetical protein